jgi:hypothetical protein
LQAAWILIPLGLSGAGDCPIDKPALPSAKGVAR